MTARIADYTTRKDYQKNYAKSNRAAINARKRAWRKAKNHRCMDSVAGFCAVCADLPTHNRTP